MKLSKLYDIRDKIDKAAEDRTQAAGNWLHLSFCNLSCCHGNTFYQNKLPILYVKEIYVSTIDTIIKLILLFI